MVCAVWSAGSTGRSVECLQDALRVGFAVPAESWLKDPYGLLSSSSCHIVVSLMGTACISSVPSRLLQKSQPRESERTGCGNICVSHTHEFNLMLRGLASLVTAQCPSKVQNQWSMLRFMLDFIAADTKVEFCQSS